MTRKIILAATIVAFGATAVIAMIVIGIPVAIVHIARQW